MAEIKVRAVVMHGVTGCDSCGADRSIEGGGGVNLSVGPVYAVLCFRCAGVLKSELDREICFLLGELIRIQVRRSAKWE